MKNQYPEYVYTDVAINGATKRNHVYHINHLPPITNDDNNCYVTMFLFKQEYKQYVQSTGSVRGANQFSVWSPYLWFDIDAEDLQNATISMQALLRGIKSMKLLRHTIVFFSGSKGYHVGINAGVFDFEPSQTLPQEMKNVALRLASLFNVEIDSSIYNHNRLWRVVDTLHKKTGFRKTKLTIKDALQLSLEEIKKFVIVKRKLKFRYITCSKATPVDLMVQLRKKANIDNKTEHNSNWDPPLLIEKHRRIIQAGVDYLLTHGIIYDSKKEGPGRDNEALLRASECRKLGMLKNECLSKILKWNALNEPALYIDDIKRVVNSAYIGKGYDFSPNSTPTLRIAREESQNNVNSSPLPDEERSIISPSLDEERSIISLNKLPQKLRNRFNIESDVEYIEGIDWANYQNTPDIEQPESLTPFHTVQVGRQNLLWCEDKGGKGTVMASEIKWLLNNTDYRIMIFNSDEPRSDLGARMGRMNIPFLPQRVSIIDNVESWVQMVANIVVFQPHIVYFDALTSILEKLEKDEVPDNGDDRNWTRIMTNFEFLVTTFNTAVHKMGICICHHSTKNSKDKLGNKTGGKAYRGSGMIAARCTTRIEVRTFRNKNETQLIYTGRHPYSPLTLKYINSTYVSVENAIDAQGESVIYNNNTIAVLSVLMAHPKSITRALLRQLANVSSGVLTRIRDQQKITYTIDGRYEVWHPTAEQIKEWRTNGIKAMPLKGNIRDTINSDENKSESE